MARRGVLESTVIIIVLGIIIKVLGFGREALIAFKFGASFSSDIYVFSVQITEILFGSIGVAIVTTFIPILTDYIENKTQKERNYFVNNVLNIIVVLAMILSLIGIICGKYVVLFFGPGFATKYSYDNFQLAIKITKIMFVSLIFIGIQNVLTGVLEAHKEFIISASRAMFYNAVIIFYLLIWNKSFGVTGLAIAIIIGYVLQMIIHIPKYKSLGYKYHFVLNIKDTSIKKILRLMIPILIGSAITQVNFLIDRILATNVGEGAISTMNFADKLNTFMYAVFGSAITTVTYSSLSTLSAQQNVDGYKKTLIHAINVINLVMIPVTIGMIILRVPLVNIAFKRGAFDTKNAMETSSVLLFYAPGMMVYGIADILNRAFYSIKDTKTPMINNAIALIINIVLNLILVKYMGINGLALATSVAGIILTILLMYSLNNKFDYGIKEIFSTFIKITISSTIMGILVNLIYKGIIRFIGINFFSELIGVIFSTVVGSIIYFIMINIFKIEECTYLTDIIKKKLKVKFKI